MKKSVFFVALVIFWVMPSCSAIFNPAGYTINIRQGTVIIAHKTGIYDFGNVDALSSSTAAEFTIKNLNVKPLNLTSTPIVQLTGANPADFAADSSLTSDVIEPGATSTFTITFNPSSGGEKSATVLIANNTNSQNPYKFTVKGTGNPVVQRTEINIKQGVDDIANTTGKYEFGSVNVGFSSPAIEFTIENLGNTALNLTGNPFKIVTNSGDAFMFIIDQLMTDATIAGGASTTFTVTFRPTSQGVKSTTIAIPNNDEDENPYIFTVSGTGAVPIVAPEINVKHGSSNIPSGTGSVDFGSVAINTSSSAIEFTIENLGNRDLLLTGNPNKIIANGGHPAMYSINQTMTNSPVAAGFETTFRITFSPTAEGVKTTTIVISNNDSDENPYTFTVTGTCTIPEINVKQDTNNIACTTGTYDFGSVGIGVSSAAVEFTIESLGNAALILSGTPKIAKTGADAAMFVINQTATTSPIAPAGSTTFTVTFSPTSVGAKTAVISIANNDLDENPYTFTVTGTGIIECTAIGWIGGGSNGWKTGTAPSFGRDFRSFYVPSGVCSDSAGNVYIADSYNYRISKWDSSGNAIGWIGGGSDGWKTGTAPSPGTGYKSFKYPAGVVVDSAGNIIVSDASNHRISKWDSAGNAIGWIGGGSNGWKRTSGASMGTSYQSFRYPYGVTLDSAGNIYVADYYNNRVSKWDAAGNAIGWIGGGTNGWKTTAAPSYASDYHSFKYPRGVSLDSAGNIYVADLYNHRISKWGSSGSAIGWIGGGSNGWKTSAGSLPANGYQSFSNPRGLFVDKSDDTIYVADGSNSRICKWNSAGNAIGWIGGGVNGWKQSSGSGSGADYRSFYFPSGVFVDSSKQIFIADSYRYRISKWQD